MIDKLFDFDEFVGIGDPWHGLWRHAEGKIEAANGVKTDVKGDPPFPWRMTYNIYGSKIGLPACDSILVRKPGADLPLPDTPPADLDLGMKLLNYNLLAGGNLRMMGSSIGWIYWAPDGSRWRVVLMGNSATFSGLAGTVNCGLQLKRFGELGGTSEIQNINLPSLPFELNQIHTPAGETINASVYIEDISRDGTKAALAVCYASTLAGGLIARTVLAIVEVTISGQPPAATVTWSVITQTKDYRCDDTRLYGSGSPTPVYTIKGMVPQNGAWLVTDGHPDPDHPPFVLIETDNWSWGEDVLCGGRYTEANTLDLVVLKLRNSAQRYNTNIEPNGLSISFSSESSATGTVELLIGGQTVFSRSGHYSGISHGTITIVGNWEMAQSHLEYSGLQQYSVTVDGQPFFALSQDLFALPGSVYGMHSWISLRDFFVLRYSNSIYGIAERRLQPIWNGVLEDKYFFSPLYGLKSTFGGEVESIFGTAYPIFASEHPVTGQIVRSTTPVCWV